MLLRQANMLDGHLCTVRAVEHAFQRGVDVSQHAEALDSNGFFMALQTLSIRRHDTAGLPAILQDCRSKLAPLVSARHAGQVPQRFQAVKTDAYAEAFSGRFRHRLESLFGHYCTIRQGGVRQVDQCGTS